MTTNKKALITGVTGQDGSYLAELLLEKGLRGARHQAPLLLAQHPARRSHLRGRARRQGALPAPLRGPVRFLEPDPASSPRSSPTRSTTSGAQSHVAVSFEAPEYTADVDGLGTLRLPGRDPLPRTREEDALLPGVDVRALRARAGDAPDRGRRRSTRALSLRLRQALRLLDHGELPRGLRHVRLQRHPVQPRVPAPRRDGSSRGRSRAASRASPRGSIAASTWATSTRSATGATRATTSRCSGACSSRTRRGTSSSPRAASTACARVHRVERRSRRARGSRSRGTGEAEVGRVASLDGEAARHSGARRRRRRRPGRSALLPPRRGGDAARGPRSRQAPARLGADDGRSRDVRRDGRPRSRVGQARSPSPGRGLPRAGRAGELRWAGRGCSSPVTAALVGRAIVRRLEAGGEAELVLRTRAELDLTDQAAVRDFFAGTPVDQGVPGRGQGRRHPRQRHVPRRVPVREPRDPEQRRARRARGRRLAAPVPRFVLHLPQARRSADRRGLAADRFRSRRRTRPTRSPRSPASSCARPTRSSTGTTTRAVMPTNLYGPFDNFHPENSHVYPRHAPEVR